MAPDGSEPLTNRRTGRSPSASERPERVAQVRTRRTAPPAQPAANPSSLPVSRLTRRNESANSFRFNRRVFQHNRTLSRHRDDYWEPPWLLRLGGATFRFSSYTALLASSHVLARCIGGPPGTITYSLPARPICLPCGVS